MKLNKTSISINDVLNRNKLLLFFTYSALLLFFSAVRIICRIFTYSDGSVLIVSLHRLGDTIFTIPAVKEIQKKYGNKVIIVCFPESIPIYNLEFDDIKFCPVTREDFYFGRRIAKHSAKSKLKELKPETIFDLTGSMISASLIFSIRTKKIIGTNANQFRTIYNHFVEFRKNPKLIDIYLDAVSPMINVINRDGLKNQLKTINPNDQILIHPFAGWKEKEWNLKSFITLAGRLNENYPVSLITQKSQLSTDVINEINHLNIELIQTNSVEELIDHIKVCSLFIGNDSGPVNIANFLGIPTLTIYGSTNPDYTATEAEHQIYVQEILNCSAKEDEKFCVIGGMIYSCSGTQCINLLTVDEVYDNLAPLIEEYCNKKT